MCAVAIIRHCKLHEISNMRLYKPTEIAFFGLLSSHTVFHHIKPRALPLHMQYFLLWRFSSFYISLLSLYLSAACRAPISHYTVASYSKNYLIFLCLIRQSSPECSWSAYIQWAVAENASQFQYARCYKRTKSERIQWMWLLGAAIKCTTLNHVHERQLSIQNFAESRNEIDDRIAMSETFYFINILIYYMPKEWTYHTFTRTYIDEAVVHLFNMCSCP